MLRVGEEEKENILDEERKLELKTFSELSRQTFLHTGSSVAKIQGHPSFFS